MHIVLLGCGAAARMHSRTIAAVAPEIDRSYASRSIERARKYRAEHGGREAFGSYREAVSEPSVDVAIILTPPSSHLELTLEALEAGKHVIVEKPAFLRPGDAEFVERKARDAGRRVMVAENYFYKPVLRALRAAVESGEIGEIHFVHLNAIKHQRTGDWRDDPAVAGGGALFEGGIHWISFAANLGLPLRTVHGHRVRTDAGLERSSLVVLEYESGAVGTLSYSWSIPSLFRGLRLSKLYGTGGSITFESNGLFLIVRARGVRARFTGGRDMLGYRAMFADFFAALTTGREPGYSFALARRDLELVDDATRRRSGAAAIIEDAGGPEPPHPPSRR